MHFKQQLKELTAIWRPKHTAWKSGNTELVLNGNIFKQNKNCKTLYRYRHFYPGFGQLMKFLVMKIFILLVLSIISIVCYLHCEMPSGTELEARFHYNVY